MDYEELAKDWERNSLLHFFGVVENIRFVVKDREHRYVYVNRVWQESFAYTDDDVNKLLGKTARDLFPQWRAERYMNEEDVVMREEKVFDYEEYLLNADGVLERWRTIKAPWVVGGEVIGFINLGARMGLVLEQRKDELPSIVHAVLEHACSSKTIEEIAQSMGVSRRTMERRFQEIMNTSLIIICQVYHLNYQYHTPHHIHNQICSLTPALLSGLHSLLSLCLVALTLYR